MDELVDQLSPKIYARNVVRALAKLQNGKHSYVPVDDIVGMVAQQMRRKRDMDNVKEHVLKSLNSMFDLGILIRNSSFHYNFYKFPELTYGCLNSVKGRRYKAGGRKPYIRPKKPIAARPKRQTMGKYQRKCKPAPIVPVVCDCCRSSVMPFVKVFNEIKKNAFDMVKMQQIKISDSEMDESVDHPANIAQRFDFQPPTMIVMNYENPLEEQTTQ
ncbi:hypothetical protein AWZ03_005926 [Drosophila navojoa]|uniref:Uncharacterized protein n=1 Tax=Drosophila navojoa TaxID=7232 RepID=A0A484BFX2_DRONA|nr:hypothetical protein AWZ03_005926 [Drosophila navojoa]